MSDFLGHAVVIDHPTFYNRHVVANVESVTAKTMMVRYYHPSRGWGDAGRRKMTAIVCVLGPIEAVTDAELTKAHERIQSWHSEATERERAAWVSYAKKVRELGGMK